MTTQELNDFKQCVKQLVACSENAIPYIPTADPLSRAERQSLESAIKKVKEVQRNAQKTQP